MLTEHKLFSMFGYASGTRAEWVVVESGSSRFKFQDMKPKDLPNILFC